MDKIDELQTLESILNSCEQDLGVFQAHRSLIAGVRETAALVRYDQPQRIATKKKALRKNISKLRTQVEALKAPTTGPRERFKIVHEVIEILNAIQRVLEAQS